MFEEEVDTELTIISTRIQGRTRNGPAFFVECCSAAIYLTLKNFFYFHRKAAEDAKKRHFSFAVEKDGKRKIINRFAIFF